MMQKCGIVLPLYKPKKEWSTIILHKIKAIEDELQHKYNLDIELHIYLVDDGSENNEHEDELTVLNNALKHFTYLGYTKNKGKGYALRYAVEKVTEPFIVYTDADFPYLAANIVEMIMALVVQKYDVVLGVRTIQYFEQLPFQRKILNLGLKAIHNCLFPYMITKDTQAGLKAFSKKGREAFLQTKSNTFLFDSEFVRIVSLQKDLRIKLTQIWLRQNVVFSAMKSATVWAELKSIFKGFLHLFSFVLIC
jgi:glycosyltransferase involved in cell wall biosynthesis